MARVVVDPVTRIEGHLRIEAEVDRRGPGRLVVVDDVPGIEIILKGRDPRDAWAFTQRICGVCARPSTRSRRSAPWRTPSARRRRQRAAAAQPDHRRAGGAGSRHPLLPPARARLGRHRVGALADPRKTSGSPSRFPTGRCRARSTSPAFAIASKDSSIAASSGRSPTLLGPPRVPAAARSEPDGRGALPRSARLAARVHQDARRARRQEPAPAELPGGRHGDADRSRQPGGAQHRNDRRAEAVRREGERLRRAVYIPDLLAIASFYKDWAGHGRGVGNYLVHGEYPEDDYNPTLFLPRGIIRGRDLSKVEPFDQRKSPSMSHSWYQHQAATASRCIRSTAKPAELHGSQAAIRAARTRGDTDKKYSWLKSPRYDGEPMEVGPLARMLVAFVSGHGASRSWSAPC